MNEPHLPTTQDRLLRAVHRNLAIRIIAATTTEVSKEARRRHLTSPAVTCALSRGLTAGLMLSTLTSKSERVTLQIQCEGPLGSLNIDAYGDGTVRGNPKDPSVWAGRPFRGRRLADLVGRDGVVNILRDVGLKERYQGQVTLLTGEIDEDIEGYLRDSEQIPSALGCETHLTDEGEVLGACGFLVQVMPGGKTDVIREAQHLLRTGALYDLLCERKEELTPEEIATTLLPSLPPSEIESLDARPLYFSCKCSLARIESMLRTLSPTDLGEMIAEGQATITCNYCSEVYVVDAESLRRLRAEVQKGDMPS